MFIIIISVYQVKTEEQISAEQAWYGSEKVWLVHKDGFSLGKLELLGLAACILISLSGGNFILLWTILFSLFTVSETL